MTTKNGLNPSGSGGATPNSAPRYGCPNCGSKDARLMAVNEDDPRDHFERWLDPAGGERRIYASYTCRKCGASFAEEVKRSG